MALVKLDDAEKAVVVNSDTGEIREGPKRKVLGEENTQR